MQSYFHKNGSLFFNEKANHVNRHWIEEDQISQEDRNEFRQNNFRWTHSDITELICEKRIQQDHLDFLNIRGQKR